MEGDEIVEAFFHRVDIAVQKLGRRGEQLFAREEDMPARLAVVGKLEEKPRLGAERCVAAKAHRERDLVAEGEVHAERAVRQ